MKQLFLLIISFFSIIATSQNQLDLQYHLPQKITYNPEIPTPKNVIGHEVGEWHITHDKLISYMIAVANASDRITIKSRGETFEGRPLVLLTITSPENHKNIEAIQSEHVKLTEVNESTNLDINTMPLVVYQGFSIHGNEPSGSNASMLLVYYLAAAQGEEINELLKNTIILLDPSYNPDGLQRFANWANSNKSKNINSDPNDREYNEIWPRGRTNHYGFDLNRDWLAVQLPETKARVKTFRSWMPNILTDHHEMGTNATFFFQPGIQSRVHPLTPKLNQELTKEIGNYHAKALDKIGSLYYTEESFDDFFYGKGSTYPDINGAIGILFEQASSRGHSQETDNGILTFPFTIRNQFTTALSTLEAAVKMRKKLLNYQRQFFKDVKNEASKSTIKAIVFGTEKDKEATYQLAKVLKRHQIKIHHVKSDFSVKGGAFKKGHSFIIPTDQKNYKIVKAMFEKRTQFTDSLFYDISAWTFPLAFNVNYDNLKSIVNIGEVVEDIDEIKGNVANKSNYAYLMEWHNYNAPKALNLILQKEIRAKVGLRPFQLDGKTYDYGTILIPVQNQKLSQNELYEFLKIVATESGMQINGVSTGLTKGIDLGSNLFKTIQKPKVAMLVGDGVSVSDAGEVWHLFDQCFDMNITRLDKRYFNRTDISKYTTLIIPSARLNFSESEIENLKQWVRNGGNLIGYKNTVKWLASNKFITIEFNESKVEANNISFEQKRDFYGAQVIGGAIFEAEIDRSHPINFGFYKDKIALFRRTKVFIKPNKESYNNPIKYTNQPLLSGYISKQNLNALKNTVPFQVDKLGKGHVLVFTDNTNFRAFWYGTNKLLMNAVFFGNIM